MAYKYRCPYCGEPAFSTAERLGVSVGGFGKFAVFYPRCPHCKNYVRRTSSMGSTEIIYGLLCLLSGFVLPWLEWGAKVKNGAVVVSILLLALGYVGIYAAFHFDKDKFEARKDPRFTVCVDVTERLPLRRGNIYVCRLLDRDPVNGVPQVIGLVHYIQKEEGKKWVTLRVIRCDDTTLPAPDERVRILTDSRYDVEGRVIDVPVGIEI